MPGTWVRDADQTQLLDTTIAAASTVSQAAVAVYKPGHVRVQLTTGAVTGADTTCDVEVQGSDDSGFASGVVSYGKFDQLDVNSDSVTLWLDAVVYKSYMRVVTVTAGAAPSVPIDIYVRTSHDHRTTSDSASDD